MNLNLPNRSVKPRVNGLNMLIDNGYPLNYFQDVIESFSEHIDFVKFGWGTSLVTKDIKKKISILKSNGIDFCMGGTLFEKYYQQNNTEGYKAFLDHYSCHFVEISNGTIDMPNSKKAEYIYDFAKHYQVFSEVGSKNTVRSENMPPSEWVTYIKEDFSAGASKVITEAREGGSSGICKSNGQLKYGLINDIIQSGFDIDKLIFEAPSKPLQVFFIEKIGINCNLANIAFADIVSLETLRLGLRSDTFYIDNRVEEEEYAEC